MKQLTKFNEYFFINLILENNSDKLPLYYSNEFRDMLYRINDEISNRLIKAEDNNGINSTKTFIDIDKSTDDKISFIVSNKIKDITKNDFTALTNNDIKLIFNARQRSTMKINKFVNNIFNNEYESKKLTEEEKEINKKYNIKTNGQKLEDFVNKFKSFRKIPNFELVNGDDIVYWYNNENYLNTNGTIGNSCMSYDRCSDYIKFYANNPDKISLLILKDYINSDKIIGRAIVWKLDHPKERIFMDRIYTIYDSDIQQFKIYAKKNKWLYKVKQDMDNKGDIFDTIDNSNKYMTLIVDDIVDNVFYPYMDTLKYYDVENEILSNSSDNLKTPKYLEDTYGGYSGGGYTYKELVDMYVDEILSDFDEYAQHYFPDLVWDYVDDNQFINDYIDNEIDYYTDDFEDLVTVDTIKEYINNNISDDRIKSGVKKLINGETENNDKDEDEDENEIDLDDLPDNEIYELVNILGVEREIVEEVVNNMYSNSSAKELLSNLYGSKSVSNMDSDVYNFIENYIDKEECARSFAEDEDEDYLRQRYE